jgi:hypothetical protein
MTASGQTQPATRRYLRLFALGRRFEPDREGRRFEPDREADRRVRRAGRFAGTFLLGSGSTAGPCMTAPSTLNIDP